MKTTFVYSTSRTAAALPLASRYSAQTHAADSSGPTSIAYLITSECGFGAPGPHLASRYDEIVPRPLPDQVISNLEKIVAYSVSLPMVSQLADMPVCREMISSRVPTLRLCSSTRISVFAAM